MFDAFKRFVLIYVFHRKTITQLVFVSNLKHGLFRFGFRMQIKTKPKLKHICQSLNFEARDLRGFVFRAKQTF